MATRFNKSIDSPTNVGPDHGRKSANLGSYTAPVHLTGEYEFTIPDGDTYVVGGITSLKESAPEYNTLWWKNSVRKL